MIKLVLPRGPLSKRNALLHAQAVANGWVIEFLDAKYQEQGIDWSVYMDECTDFTEEDWKLVSKIAGPAK